MEDQSNIISDQLMDLARGRLYEPEKSALERLLHHDAALQAELHFYKQVYAAMPKAAARRAAMILQEMQPGLQASGVLYSDEILLAAIKDRSDTNITGQLAEIEKTNPEFARRMAELRRLSDDMDAMMELNMRNKIQQAALQWQTDSKAPTYNPATTQPGIRVQRNNIFRIALLAASFAVVFFASWLVLRYMNQRYDPLALQNLAKAPETERILSEAANGTEGLQPNAPARPTEPQLKKQKGIHAIQSKSYEEAEISLKQYVSENQHDSQALFYLGLNYLFAKKPVEAEATFLKVMETSGRQDENYDPARWYLTNLYLAKAANREKGVQLLREIVQDNKSRFQDAAVKKLQTIKE